MAENLDYVVEGSKCYDNDPSYCNIYGSLYDWATAMNLPPSCNYNSCSNQIQYPHRGICPSGWHIPSSDDAALLVNQVGGYETAGKYLKVAGGWWEPYSGIENLDTWGFSALPGGGFSTSGSFYDVGSTGNWWGASEDGSYDAYVWYMFYDSDYAYGSWGGKGNLLSVRCLQDGNPVPSVPSSSSSAWSSSSLGSSYGYCSYYNGCEYMSVNECYNRGGSNYGDDNTCGNYYPSSSSSSFIAHSGRGNSIGNYRTIVIGTQNWMAENLDYVVAGSKCYNNDPFYCNNGYGSLYDWATAMNLPSSCNDNNCSDQIQSPHRGICPAGWHIPSYDDWNTLSSYVESNSGCSSCDASKLKAMTRWDSGGNGTDEYGFSALPGGYGFSDGSFDNVGIYGFWWSADEFNSYYAFNRSMYYDYDFANWYNDFKSRLLSVRCLQD
jgi:uncharacterized protein (TIGR02145 family)